MRAALISSSAGLLLSFATAQDCIVRPATLSQATVPFDHVFPIQPIGFPFPLGGATWSDIHVTTKGMCYLSNGGVPAPGTADFSATPGELVNGPPRLCPFWTDIGPGLWGNVYQEPSATRFTVTWVNAANWPGDAATPTFDVQMHLFPSGRIEVLYSAGTTNDSAFNSDARRCIVGWSPGGGVALPLGVDLSAGGTAAATTYEYWQTPNTFDLASRVLRRVPAPPPAGGFTFGTVPLDICASVASYGEGCHVHPTLAAVGLPTPGNSTFVLRALDLFPTAPVAWLFFGDRAIPPIDLYGILTNVTGCFAYTNASFGAFTVDVVTWPLIPGYAGAYADYALPIPANPGLVGQQLTSQLLAPGAFLFFDMMTTNGLVFRIGV